MGSSTVHLFAVCWWQSFSSLSVRENISIWFGHLWHLPRALGQNLECPNLLLDKDLSICSHRIVWTWWFQHCISTACTVTELHKNCSPHVPRRPPGECRQYRWQVALQVLSLSHMHEWMNQGKRTQHCLPGFKDIVHKKITHVNLIPKD